MNLPVVVDQSLEGSFLTTQLVPNVVPSVAIILFLFIIDQTLVPGRGKLY